LTRFVAKPDSDPLFLLPWLPPTPTNAPDREKSFCFWINLPVGLVTVITVVFFMKLPPVVKEKGMMWKKFRAIDWIGTALLATGVSLLLVGLTSGGVDHPW
jgi:hypothetical protein